MVSGYSWDRAKRVARWPLEEVLEAYLAEARREALREYRQQRLEYYVIAPWSKRAEAPDVPTILEERRNGHA